MTQQQPINTTKALMDLMDHVDLITVQSGLNASGALLAYSNNGMRYYWCKFTHCSALKFVDCVRLQLDGAVDPADEWNVIESFHNACFRENRDQS